MNTSNSTTPQPLSNIIRIQEHLTQAKEYLYAVQHVFYSLEDMPDNSTEELFTGLGSMTCSITRNLTDAMQLLEGKHDQPSANAASIGS